MIRVDEARARILDGLSTGPSETVPLLSAQGRVLAAPLTARHTQPERPVSAMDGYAVRAEDLNALPTDLNVTQTIAAGSLPTQPLTSGHAARIFTGAVLPDNADTVVAQEDTAQAEGRVTIREGGPRGRHVRAAGRDFAQGDVLLEPGAVLGPHQIALAAAAGWAEVPVIRRPRIGVLATGDELIRPGEAKSPVQTIASSLYGVMAAVADWGGEAVDLGIAPDTEEALDAALTKAREMDVLVTLGGASVGDHDLVQDALKRAGFTIDFWRIAMRPGKPLMFARRGAQPALGLPGNPVSALVCALLFLRPALGVMTGRPATAVQPIEARLATPLGANDSARQDHMRARLTRDGTGWSATPFPAQDSSMLSVLARSGGLIIRPPHVPEAPQGAIVPVLPLGPLD